jgi:hypothetical protein
MQPVSQLTLLILASTIVILLFAILAVSLLFSDRQKSNRISNNIEDMKSQHERMILQTQIEIQEQTLCNISREIHDNISLSLTLAKLNLCTLANEPENRIAEPINLITKALDDLRNLSNNLNSDLISQQGLIISLERENKRINSLLGLKAELEITGQSLYLDGNKELVIFRIIQEAYTNILKHSQANTITTRLLYQEAHIEIEVIDNGIGIREDESTVMAGGGNGLVNIRKRTSILNGTFDIVTKEQQGTKLHFKIPY